MTEVPAEDLKILFDALVQSLDFGSGFLDTEEVEALRRIAVLIGIDPTDATPEAFAAQYVHGFRPRATTWPMSADRCDHCRRTAEDPVHHTTPQAP